MASEFNKKRARHIYRLFTVFHWTLFFVVSITDGLAIGYAEGTIAYWGGGLALAIMLFFVSIQDSIILKNVMIYEKSELAKKRFIDTFNWHGLNILLCFPAGVAGIAVAAAMGSNYGRHEHNDKNETLSEHIEKHEKLVNEEGNRIIGTLLAIFCGITVAIMVRTICLHGEVRAALGLPEKSTPPPQTTPTTTPAPAANAAASNSASASSTPTPANQVLLLKSQNTLLKEQNRLQREQLEQLTALNQNLHGMGISSVSGGNPVPPPPDYSTVAAIDGPPPGYASAPPGQGKY